MTLPNNLNRFGGGRAKPYYCEVEYLESSGTQYIDTLENDTTGYVYKANITPLADGAWSLWFGRQDTVTGGQCEFVGYNGDNKLGASILTAGVGNTIGAQTAATNTLYNIETSSIEGDVYFSVDGTKTTAVRTGAKCNRNIYIFCINNAGTANNFSSIQVNKFQMYDSNGTLVRDFIPVLDWNMTPCLYDKVSQQLFYNQGTGSFTAGRQIHYVEYIESTGTQYINTGVLPTKNTETEEKIRPLTNLSGSSTSFCRWTPGPAYDTFGHYFNGVQSCVVYFGRYSDGMFATLLDFDIGEDLVIKNMKTFVSINEVETPISRGDGGWNNTQYPLYLFAGDNQGTATFFAQIKVYYQKIWEDGVPIRDYKPAVDEYGVGFMFDKVEHKIYDNAGSGTFNYPDVPLEYLESTGTQYINTDYTSNNVENIKYKMGVYPLQNSNLQVMAGSQQYNNTQDCYSIQLNSTGRVFVGAYTKYYDSTTLSNNTYYDIETYSEAGNRYTITNGTTITNTTITGGVNLDFPVVLFAHNSAGSVDYFSSIRLYYFQEYVNSVLVRDMIPVLHNEVGCMYDKISNTYFTNSGTGTFNFKIKEKK